MPKLITIAKKYNLKVIEDASEVIGLKINNRMCGSFGDISTFSFYTNKHITTGEGGMVFTNNTNLAKKSRNLRNLFFGKKRFFNHEIGWNYRMSNLQAAVGLAQFENINKIINLKRKFGNIYHKELKRINSLSLQLNKTDYSKNIYWVIGVVIKNRKQKAEKIIKKLNEKGIQTRPFFGAYINNLSIKNINTIKSIIYRIQNFYLRMDFIYQVV